MYSIGYTGSKEILFIGLIIGSAVAGFVLFFVLGILGSIIGVKLNTRNANKIWLEPPIQFRIDKYSHLYFYIKKKKK